MQFESVKEWLTRRQAKAVGQHRLAGALGYAFVPVVLAGTWWFVYGLLFLSSRGEGNIGVHKLIAFATLPVLFLIHALLPKLDLAETVMDASLTDVEGVVTRRIAARLFWVSVIFLTGPKLAEWAGRQFRQAREWRELDVHSCAAVLSVLMGRPGKVSYEQIEQQLDWLSTAVVRPQLKLLGGVVELDVAPPGLSFTPELRADICGVQK